MTTAMQGDNAFQEIEQQLRHKRGKLTLFTLLAGGVVLLGLALLFTWNYREKKAHLLADLQQHAELLAQSKGQMLETWLADLTEQGGRLINSDLFRLYATDIDFMQGDPALILSQAGQNIDQTESTAEESDDDVFMLAAQLPMMSRLLEEFVSYSGFVAGRIVNREGITYIATDANVSPMTIEQLAGAKEVFATGLPCYLPFRVAPSGLVLDMLLPIFSTQDKENPQVAAVLLLRRPAAAKLTEIISNSPLGEQAFNIRLVQQGEPPLEILPWTADGLIPTDGLPPEALEGLPFAQRPSLDGKSQVFSLSVPVAKAHLMVLAEVDQATALADVNALGRRGILLAVLGTGLALLLGVGMWWWLVGRENKRLALRYCDMAMRIDDQKAFLDSVTEAISELIGIKDMNDGKYVFANRSLGEAVGKEPEALKGLDDQALFGFDTAKRLEHSDTLVKEKRSSVTSNEVIYLKSQKHHFEIVKSPFPAKDENPWGILSVMRDDTEEVRNLEEKKLLMDQTVDALVRTIEAKDPYLGGHTRLMNRISSEIALRLHLSEEDKATVSAAANLSQIGKMFVPTEILNKPGKLTDEELRTMRRHVEHARDILGGINFELPVVEALSQMHENLDGSGYPEGLAAEQIVTSAKILAVANGFCALIRPRSYRPALSVDDALQAMEGKPEQYSSHIVAVLREFLASSQGERLLAEQLSK